MQNKKDSIEKILLKYFTNNFPDIKKLKNIPKDKSLVELGYLDSFAVIDMVTFIEKEWNIKIEDNEITKKYMGSINKMVALIKQKFNLKTISIFTTTRGI